MEPRTWTAREIQQLIAEELREYRVDCVNRQRQFTPEEAAELILDVLDGKGLIEYTP